MSSTQEKCPYCGQSVTNEQFSLATEKMKDELKKDHQSEIYDLTEKLREKEKKIQEGDYENKRHMQDLEYEADQTLSEIKIEHAKKINAMMDSNDETINKLRSKIEEDNLANIRLTTELNKSQDILRKKQSELIGEVGEIELLKLLKESFPDDDFTTQSKGTAEADIVQTIKHNNQVLDIRICYDNKQNTQVTKTHVDKAKAYQQIHNTKYVLIVSSILPKMDIPNSFIGSKDGILLVHPKIVVAVVTILRENLITLQTKTLTETNRGTKESQLYDFITGHQFAMQFSVISNCYNKLNKLLQTEQTSHTRSWKQRQKILEELFHTKIEIEQEIIVITGKDIAETKLDDSEVVPESF